MGVSPEEMDRRKRIIKEIAERVADEYSYATSMDPPLSSYIHDAIYEALGKIEGRDKAT